MVEFKSFIVLEGHLHESMEFELIRGFETFTTMEEDRAIRQDNIVTARLLNNEGETLAVATPEVRFPVGCTAAPSTPGLGLLRVILARHPFTRSIELRAFNRPIFSAPVAIESPPAFEIKLEPSSDNSVISFRLEPAPHQSYDLQFFVVDSTNRRIRVNPTVKKAVYSLKLRHFGGKESARICVTSSRDFRTTETFSSPFDLPELKIQGRILEPLDQAELSSGFPGSLVGNLSDNNGRAVQWEKAHVVWVVDNTSLHDSRQIVSYEDLSPGKHIVELRYHPVDGQAIVLDKVIFFVREKSDQQKEYDDVLARYLATQKRTLNGAGD